ncbi:MAG: aldo/keto reductase [Chitinispirillales bacterium]|jgi:predicted oxidoreductase|nr:aldo/keto reductase [Chitinispirillales bacterium]
MKKIELGKSGLQIPNVAVGCMRISSMPKNELKAFVECALETGANFFDHADIYGDEAEGDSESAFAEAIGMNGVIREKMIIQSKCGIRENSFDFSKEYILKSVDGSLKRLKTDYLDILLLHRPDALYEPEEIAETFDILQNSGKVRHFGVSNQKPMQIELLKKFVKQKIAANQLQLSVTNANMITHGFFVNMETEQAIARDESVLDYCRLNDITIQAWSPFQYGFFKGVFIGSPKHSKLNKKLDKIAKKYGVSSTTIALAWILRHPAKIQAVTGTTNVSRLKECLAASEIKITREEWYEILLSAPGNYLP